MVTQYLNEIVLKDPALINAQMINYLMAHREDYNLMIMAASVSELDWKQAYLALTEEFNNKLNDLSDNDKDRLSKFSSLVRFRDYDNNCTRGLCVTFGRQPAPNVYESTFLNNVQEFISNLPTRQDGGMVEWISMPLLRMTLMIHGMRSSISNSAQIEPYTFDEYALLDFHSENWRYTTADSNKQYRVHLKQNNGVSDAFYLQVSSPHKQFYGENLSKHWVFDDPQTGFTFYNAPEPKFGKAKDLKKTLYASKSTESIPKLTENRLNHEVYWQGVLVNLLETMGVEYHFRPFRHDIELFTGKAFNNRKSWLTTDFMGVAAQALFENETLSLKYFIEPDAMIDQVGEKVEQALDDVLSSINQGKSHLRLSLSVATSQEHADLVIGRYNQEARWTSSPSTDEMDAYGQAKMSALLSQRINRQQFIDFSNLSRSALERSLSECLLKRWITQPHAEKIITIDDLVFPAATTLSVISTQRQKQKTDEKKKPLNLFFCAYLANIESNLITFTDLAVHAEMGVPPYSSNRDKPLLDDFYHSRLEHLPVMMDIVEMIGDSEDEDGILDAIGVRYLNNDCTLIFEHDGEKIISIWETQSDKLWIQPDLENSFPEDGTFTNFIKTKQLAGAYTAQKEKSQIQQSFRRTKDAHYTAMIDDDSLIIHRLRYNPNKDVDRHLARKFKRIYPVDSKLSQDDCSVILAGLLSDQASAYKDSGVSETIYEKIPKLVTF